MTYSRRLRVYLLLTLPMLAAFLLYGYTVRLPFFMDDGVLMALVRENIFNGAPLLHFWGGNPPSGYYFGYYRPLVFTLWELHGTLLNARFDPVTLHTLNIWVYGLTGCGVAALARRLTRSLAAGVIAGVFFVVFPFNYNAAMWIASLFHLIAVMGMVLALYFGIHAARGKHSKTNLLLTTLFAFIAVFSHENGVLIAPLLAIALLVVGIPRVWRLWRAWLAVILTGVVAVVYVFLFLTLPGVETSGSSLQLEAVPGNLAIFLQGLVYPTAALVRRVLHLEAETRLFYLLTAITVLPLLLVLWLRARRLFWVALYGLFWFAFAALPTILLLTREYIVGSWRLMLVSAPGAGLFWGAALVGLWSVGRGVAGRNILRPYTVGRIAAVAIVLWGMFVSVAFLAQRRDEALRQAVYMDDLQTLIEQQAMEGRPTVINAPTFIADVDENRYFLTVGMGVIMVAPFVNYNLLYQAETGTPFPYTQALIYQPTFHPPAYLNYAPYITVPPDTDFTQVLRDATHIYATVFHGDEIYPLYVGSPGEAGSDVAMATFGGVALTEAHAELSAPDRVIVYSRWRVDTPSALMPVVEVTCDGEVVGEAGAAVWGGTYPFSVWQAGETQTDRREVRLSRAVTSECLAVNVRVVDEADPTQVIAPVGEGIEGESVTVEVRR